MARWGSVCRLLEGRGHARQAPVTGWMCCCCFCCLLSLALTLSIHTLTGNWGGGGGALAYLLLARKRARHLGRNGPARMRCLLLSRGAPDSAGSIADC